MNKIDNSWELTSELIDKNYPRDYYHFPYLQLSDLSMAQKNDIVAKMDDLVNISS
jgi:hypothetical protein